MAESLHRGEVDAVPLEKSGACSYCAYRDICRFEDGGTERPAPHLSTEEAVAELRRRYEEVETDG